MLFVFIALKGIYMGKDSDSHSCTTALVFIIENIE